MRWLEQCGLYIIGLKRRWQGLIVGCALWLFWMIFGFWATVLLIVLGALGYAIGRVLEARQSWRELVDKLLSERFGD